MNTISALQPKQEIIYSICTIKHPIKAIITITNMCPANTLNPILSAFGSLVKLIYLKIISPYFTNDEVSECNYDTISHHMDI